MNEVVSYRFRLRQGCDLRTAVHANLAILREKKQFEYFMTEKCY